jgi:hypothetical protein
MVRYTSAYLYNDGETLAYFINESNNEKKPLTERKIWRKRAITLRLFLTGHLNETDYHLKLVKLNKEWTFLNTKNKSQGRKAEAQYKQSHSKQQLIYRLQRKLKNDDKIGEGSEVYEESVMV